MKIFLRYGLVLAILLAPLPVAALEIDSIDATLHGFFDSRYGQRLQQDPYQRDDSLGETRLQLGLSRLGDATTLELRGDFYYDDLVDQDDVDLESGAGWFDLREANLLFSPVDIVDVKIGRQILTWGTGDLLFINDLFPKDWKSFFIGRDQEYLKAPSDAMFVSLFPGGFDVNIVYTPRFDADRYIRGERISYWNPLLGRIAGRDAIMDVQERDDWFSDDEYALRLTKNAGGYELALYGYYGYWKSPVGYDMLLGKAVFPELAVYGASLRGTLGPGIAHVEAGYYDSREDRDGDDPLLPNSELRLLAGYEQELVRNLTVAGQYYLEVLQDYAAYRQALPGGMTVRDEHRHVVTLRLTWMLLNQNLTLSLFGYYSPSDEDNYLRPTVDYKLTDTWLLSIGGNIFAGEKQDTFFGQFDYNSNAYAGVRYNF